MTSWSSLHHLLSAACVQVKFYTSHQVSLSSLSVSNFDAVTLYIFLSLLPTVTVNPKHLSTE